MSAAKIGRPVEQQTDAGDPALPTPRDLILADLSIVQRQNVSWLSRRFGFSHHLLPSFAPAEDDARDTDPSTLAGLPTWRRRVTLLHRALLADPEARGRLKKSFGLRVLRRLRRRELAPQPITAPDSDKIDQDAYLAWIERYDRLGAADRAVLALGAAAPEVPDVLLVVRFDDAGTAGAVASALRGQIHRRWRALFVMEGVAERPALADARIRVLSAADAERAADPAPLVVLADADVALRPETLFAFAEAARQDPGLRLIYADEDRIGADGVRAWPMFKPSFSPELSRRLDYLGGCVAVERAALPAFLRALEPVAAWASLYAAGLVRAEVGHIPRVLFHTHRTTPPARRTLPPPPEPTPTVAIIIPTRNHADLLDACIRSIRETTRYPQDRIHIIVVDNGSNEPSAHALFERLRAEPGCTVIPDPRPFNYARLNNVAARQAGADVLLFLNNDTEVTDPDWLRTLATLAMQPDTGVVGAKLLYPDRTVQHGGVVLGIGGVAGHSFIGLAADNEGYLGLASTTREVAAVTGACMAIRRSVFEELGGFDEVLEIAFNDTALCCGALRRGYRNLYAGEASLLHHESKSRGFEDTPEKLRRFRQECVRVRGQYKTLFDEDPFYSPSLGLERQYQPAVPRHPRLWRGHRRRVDPALRVLILSAVHATGHGVPVVIKQHAEYLAKIGCTVFVGGPLSPNEIEYERCHRVFLDGPHEAQSFAYEADVDCVIAHTMPFFSMFRLMGSAPRRVIFDHGEPPPSWFPDRQDRENIDAEKQFCYRFAELVLTNTATVKDEIGFERAEVAGLGNAHLATWDGAAALRRETVRAQLGLEGKFVVLNVCRFHRPERVYKGIDDYVALRRRLIADRPDLADRVVFVLCGKGTARDQEAMAAEGLRVFANVPDAELADLYLAADLYANFSKWEGFNLGIGQALAMGLNVVASATPAHRAFPIATSDDEAERVRLVADAAAGAAGERNPVLMPWEPLLEWLHSRLLALREQPA